MTVTAEAPEMARTKRDPDSWNRKPVVLMMRGAPEYKVWLEEFAEKQGMSVSVLVDQAVRLLAKREGFRDPPKR
jgi:hypothetical protein